MQRQDRDILRFSNAGGAPKLSLEFIGDSLPAGHYILSGKSSGKFGDNVLVNPAVELVTPQQSLSMHVPVRQSAKGWTAPFILPAPIQALRFLPLDRPGSICLEGLRLKKVSEAQYFIQLGITWIRNRIRRPGDLFSAGKAVWRAFSRGGIRQIRSDLRFSSSLPRDGFEYADWVAAFDTPTQQDLQRLSASVERLAARPKFSILLPVYNSRIELLEQTIASVQAQVYPDWELCITDDASTDPSIWRLLERYAKEDPRIHLTRRSENGHISRATNTALDMARGDWVAFLDHDDLLAPHALYEVASMVGSRPELRLIYSDEDKIDGEGRRFAPHFKCDWNLDLILSCNYMNHLLVADRVLVTAVGGLNENRNGAQDWDFILKCVRHLSPGEIGHIPHVLYHWRAAGESASLSEGAKPYAVQAARDALSEHLKALDVQASVDVTTERAHVRYGVPAPLPRVSIIIPTHNGKDLVEQCIQSLERLTAYPNYEIILVDNRSDDAAAKAYFASLQSEGRVRVLRYDKPFNYSAINNFAVSECSGDIICLLNNDIEIISPDWLDEMVGISLQPGVGAVGAMLYYPGDTIQHAGVVLGLGGVAAHIHSGLPREAAGYQKRAMVRQTLSAVTAACLVVQRQHWDAVGGLNEDHLAVAYNDVDFCLRLGQIGLRCVWTPFAELYHHESASRGAEDTDEKRERFESEQDYMRTTWPDLIAADPAYSPNLSLNSPNFELAFPPRRLNSWQRLR